MTLLAERQRAWIDDYGFIPDARERLAALVDHGEAHAAAAPAERCEEQRVEGCVSPVWVGLALEEGRCRFQVAADAVMVRGLVGLLARFYNGAGPGEVVEVEPEFLEALGVFGQLSPTRARGLRAVRSRMRALAREAVSAGSPPATGRPGAT